MRRQAPVRGSALVGAVAIAVVMALLIGSALVVNTTYYRSAYSKADAEAALLLAEAGVNDELNAISYAIATSASAKGTSNATQPGEPFPGRKGTLPGVPGTYWVFTSADADGKQAWTGQSLFYITCHARVGQATRRVRIGAPNQYQSIFSVFGFFALDSSMSGNAPAVSMSGSGTVVEVDGIVGTNGRLQGGTGVLTYKAAMNYNTAEYANSSATQFTAQPLFEFPDRLELPTVVEVIREVLPATKSMTETALWNHVIANRQNANLIKMWKPGLPAGSPLTPANVVSANYPTSGSSSTSLTNKSGNNYGHWQGASKAPGNGPRTLILQPGDYYFDTVNLIRDANTEMIVDNAGLSVPGGNPYRVPIRVFMSGSGSDDISIQIRQTAPLDSATFRVFYSKDGQSLKFSQPTDDGDAVIACGVYAVTIGKDPTKKGTRLRVFGGNSQRKLILNGGLIADQIDFNGVTRIYFTHDSIQSLSDPAYGVGFNGGYRDD